jgi:hypothetical protein
MNAAMIIPTHVRAPLQKDHERERTVLRGGGKIGPWCTLPPHLRADAMEKTSWCWRRSGKPVKSLACGKWRARIHRPKAKRKEEEMTGSKPPRRSTGLFNNA